MKHSSQTYIAGCALATLAGFVPIAAGAIERPATTTFIVTSIAGSTAGPLVAHESLSLQRDTPGARLRLASTDGSVISTPLRLTADGMIASATQDTAVTCYNMAANALARMRQPDGGPASVFVRFGQTVVHVPITVTKSQTHGSVHTTVLHGESSGTYTTGSTPETAGIIIQATIEDADGELHGAMFDEVQYLDTPHNVVAHSTCILQRAATPVVTPV